MGDIALVQVAQSRQQLLDDSFGFVLWKPPLWLGFKMCVQTLTLDVLHDEVDVLRRVDGLVKFHHAAVAKFT